MSNYHESSKARRDLHRIYNYIADESSESRADKYLKKLEKTMQTLADSPDMGSPRDYTPPGVLAFPKDDYMIFYRKQGPTVEIYRVLHSARDIENLLGAWEK